jgi:hypothetical protein
VICDNGTLYDNRCLAACDGQTRCLGTNPMCREGHDDDEDEVSHRGHD